MRLTGDAQVFLRPLPDRQFRLWLSDGNLAVVTQTLGETEQTRNVRKPAYFKVALGTYGFAEQRVRCWYSEAAAVADILSEDLQRTLNGSGLDRNHPDGYRALLLAGACAVMAHDDSKVWSARTLDPLLAYVNTRLEAMCPPVDEAHLQRLVARLIATGVGPLAALGNHVRMMQAVVQSPVPHPSAPARPRSML